MTAPEPEDNYQRIEDLEEENHSLREELTRIQSENDRLREEVKKREKLLRGKARSAPPFSKGKRKAHPKRPGRKPGQGPFQRRAAPPAAATARPVEVPVTSMRCPCCGGELKCQRTDRVTTTDMPAQPQPEVKVYDVAVCVCTACGKSVRGEHPEIASNQYGATAHGMPMPGIGCTVLPCVSLTRRTSAFQSHLLPPAGVRTGQKQKLYSHDTLRTKRQPAIHLQHGAKSGSSR